MSQAEPELCPAGRQLGRASVDRRRLALARFLDLVDPADRPAELPGPEGLTELQDPVGDVLGLTETDTGWKARVRAPRGLVAIPGDLAAAQRVHRAALAVVAGNAIVLPAPEPGEPDLPALLARALDEAGLPSEAVTADPRSPTTEPASPEAVHAYLDGAADVDAALDDLVHAVGEAPLATDTILVHEALATEILEPLVDALEGRALAVEAGEAARRRAPAAGQARADTWEGPRSGAVGVRVVGSLAEALDHVQAYGGRAEAIATRDPAAARRFVGSLSAPRVGVAAPTTSLPADEPPAPPEVDDPSRPVDLTRERVVVVGADTDAVPAEARTSLSALVAHLLA